MLLQLLLRGGELVYLLGRHPTCRQRSNSTSHTIANTTDSSSTRLARTSQTRPQHLRQGLLLLELRHLRRLDLNGRLRLRAGRHDRHHVRRAAAPPPREGPGAPLLPLVAAPRSGRRAAAHRRPTGAVAAIPARGRGIVVAGPMQRGHVRVEVVDQNEAPPAGLPIMAATAADTVTMYPRSAPDAGVAGIVRTDAGVRRHHRPGRGAGLAQQRRNARHARRIGRVQGRPGLGIEQVVRPAVEGVVRRRVDVAAGDAVPAPDPKLDVILPHLGRVALLDPVVPVVLVVAGLGPVVQDERPRRWRIRRGLRRYCQRRLVLIEQMLQLRHLTERPIFVFAKDTSASNMT